MKCKNVGCGILECENGVKVVQDEDKDYYNMNNENKRYEVIEYDEDDDPSELVKALE